MLLGSAVGADSRAGTFPRRWNTRRKTINAGQRKNGVTNVIVVARDRKNRGKTLWKETLLKMRLLGKTMIAGLCVLVFGIVLAAVGYFVAHLPRFMNADGTHVLNTGDLLAVVGVVVAALGFAILFLGAQKHAVTSER